MLPAPPVEDLDKDSPVVTPRIPTVDASVEDINLLDHQLRTSVASYHAQVPYTPATGFGPLQSNDASRGSDYRQAQGLVHESAAGTVMLTNMDLPMDFGFDPMDPCFTGYGLDCTFAPFSG
jgi:hypothetical protein